MCSYVRSNHSHRPLVGRTRLFYKASTPQTNSSRIKAAVGTAPRTNSTAPGSDSAASLVWGLKPVDKPTIHVLIQPDIPATEIVPLQVEQLHPDLLTKPTFTEFLAKNVISRAAKRQGVIAMVLSAPCLPSQLQYMEDLANKQSVGLDIYLSRRLNSALHAVFTTVRAQQYSSTALQSALEAALGSLQSLADAKLQVAEPAEQSLQQQLRLWEPSIWSTVLQQKLQSYKYGAHSWLVARSLMGPPALQAARKLVEKQGLHWTEVQEKEVQALVGSAGSSSSNSRRRRKGSSSVVPASDCEETSGPDGGQQGAAGGSVIVISSGDLTVEDALQVAAYELYGRSIGRSDVEVHKAEPGDKPLPAGLPRIIWPFSS